MSCAVLGGLRRRGNTLSQRLKSLLDGCEESNAKNVQRRANFHQEAYYRSGALKPMPFETNMALGRVLCAVIPGLFIGAAISKSMANFLEENDLFVPDDDDDDGGDDD